MKSVILFTCIVAFCNANPLSKPSTNPYEIPNNKNPASGLKSVSPQENPFGPVPPNNKRQTQAPSQSTSADGSAKTISLEQTIPGDGTYSFSYETDNGIKASEQGKQKQIGEEWGAEAIGEYSFKAPDGETYSVSYTADENGYQPVGAHLPTPPPIPDGILKLLALIAKQEQEGNQK